MECFGQCVFQSVVAACPFAQIHFCAVAVVAVVVVLVVYVPSWVDIVVFVNDVNVFFACQLPSVFVVATFEERTNGAYYLYVGVALLDASIEEVEALGKHVGYEVFVSDAEILEVERLWMTC